MTLNKFENNQLFWKNNFENRLWMKHSFLKRFCQYFFLYLLYNLFPRTVHIYCFYKMNKIDGFCKLLTLVLITLTFFQQNFHKKMFSEKIKMFQNQLYNK